MPSNRELALILRLRDQASAAMKQFAEKGKTAMTGLRGALGNLAQNFSLLKTAIGAVVGSVVVRTFIRGINALTAAWSQQEDAITRLSVAMASQGEFSREALQRNLDFAASLQKITTAGDETILAGQVMLGTFIGFDSQMDRASRAAIDLAAFMGQSADQGFMKLAQAAGNGTLMLGRMSVRLSDAKDPAQRLEDVLTGLEQRMGGLGEAMRYTTSGALKAFSNAWGDLKEQIGLGIAPTMKALAKTMEDVVSDPALVRGAVELGKTLAGAFLLGVKGVTALVAGLRVGYGGIKNTLTVLVKSVTAALAAIYNALDEMVAYVAQRVVPGFVLMGLKWKEVYQIMKQVAITVTAEIVNAVFKGLSDIFRFLEKTIEDLRHVASRLGLTALVNQLSSAEGAVAGLSGSFASMSVNAKDAVVAVGRELSATGVEIEKLRAELGREFVFSPTFDVGSIISDMFASLEAEGDTLTTLGEMVGKVLSIKPEELGLNPDVLDRISAAARDRVRELNDDTVALIQQAEQEIVTIRATNATDQMNMLRQQGEERLAIIRADTDAQIAEMQRRGAGELAIQNQVSKNAAIIQRVQTANMARENQVRMQNFASAWAFISDSALRENKQLFEVFKAADIAQAIIDTYAAANKALNAAPPPLNYALVAAVVAAGMANVQRIRSTQFGGGGGGNPSVPTAAGGTEGIGGGTGIAGIGEGTIPLGPAEQMQIGTGRAMPQVSITVNGVVGNEQEVARRVAELVNQAIGQGAEIILQ